MNDLATSAIASPETSPIDIEATLLRRDAAIPRLEKTSCFGDLRQGFTLPLKAFRLIWKVPRLRNKALLMGAVVFIVLTGLFGASLFAAPALVEHFWPAPEAWYAVAARALVKIVTFITLFIIGASTLPKLLLSPFSDPLSAETERALGFEVTEGDGLSHMVRSAIRTLFDALTRTLLYLAGHALLLPLLFVPGLGAALGWSWSVVWITLDSLDGPMTLHLYKFKHAFDVFRRRKRLFFGFGTAILLLQWIPILNALFLPVAIVSATLLMRGLIEVGELPSPESVSSELPPGVDAA
ncbi:MAG: EI24 domain-containing protein [Myxococcales bacterium]|jgi:CysZ protein|nr:EI24 domain-containing protein [Myxococcales bacterium]